MSQTSHPSALTPADLTQKRTHTNPRQQSAINGRDESFARDFISRLFKNHYDEFTWHLKLRVILDCGVTRMFRFFFKEVVPLCGVVLYRWPYNTRTLGLESRYKSSITRARSEMIEGIWHAGCLLPCFSLLCLSLSALPCPRPHLSDRLWGLWWLMILCSMAIYIKTLFL